MDSEAHLLLQAFFIKLIRPRFDHDCKLRDAALQEYVANLLTAFSRTEQLFKIKDEDGRPLTDIGEMLLESDPIYGPAPHFEREREVRQHIGDYTLFLCGMLPRSINPRRLRRTRLESFVEFARVGRESYFIASKFAYCDHDARLAPVFAVLAREFENCVHGLHLVRNDLVTMQHSCTQPKNILIT